MGAPKKKRSFFWDDDNFIGWLMVNVQNTIGTLVYFWINYSFLGFYIGITIYFSNLFDYTKALVNIVNETCAETGEKTKRLKAMLVELIGIRIYQQE